MYGFFAALGFISGYFLLINRAGKYGLDKNIAGDIAFYSAVAGIIGARASYVIVNWDYYSKNLSEIYKIYNGGIIFYGGALAGLICGTIITRLKKINPLQMLDIAAPALALGHFFGRIGCFMFGCCHGRVCSSSSFTGVIFPKYSPAYYRQIETGIINPGTTLPLPVIPTQLFESAFLLILSLTLIFYDKKIKRFNGELFAVYLLLYSIFRFIIENFRGDYDHQFIYFGILTFSQLISLTLFVISIIILKCGNKKKK